jgi:hypothetical protein
MTTVVAAPVPPSVGVKVETFVTTVDSGVEVVSGAVVVVVGASELEEEDEVEVEVVELVVDDSVVGGDELDVGAGVGVGVSLGSSVGVSVGVVSVAVSVGVSLGVSLGASLGVSLGASVGAFVDGAGFPGAFDVFVAGNATVRYSAHVQWHDKHGTMAIQKTLWGIHT